MGAVLSESELMESYQLARFFSSLSCGDSWLMIDGVNLESISSINETIMLALLVNC
jgi:hypothetical protein